MSSINGYGNSTGAFSIDINLPPQYVRCDTVAPAITTDIISLATTTSLQI